MADPKTKQYRVLAVGVGYSTPTEITADDGSTATLNVRREAHTGDVIDLEAKEAQRLLDLGAVVDADAPATYREMKVADLKAAAEERGLTVEGTGADGRVVQEDLVAALEADDASKGVS